jgi:hypothetical protein
MAMRVVAGVAFLLVLGSIAIVVSLIAFERSGLVWLSLYLNFSEAYPADLPTN